MARYFHCCFADHGKSQSSMPTYQYRCKQCGNEFEKVQSFSDESTPKCPSCGTRSKKNISKVFGQVGISFKGSGFYKNDHGKKSKVADSPPSSDSGSSNGDSSTKSESSKSESSTKSDSSSSKSASSD